MAKYTALGLSDSVQPSLNGLFTITVDQCLVTIVQPISTDVEATLTYTIGQEDPATHTLEVQRLANCDTGAVLTILVDGVSTDLTTLQASFGVQVVTKLSLNFEKEKITFQVTTTDASLGGQTKVIGVSYEVDGVSHTFQNINIEYLAGETHSNCTVGSVTFDTENTIETTYEIGAYVAQTTYITIFKG